MGSVNKVILVGNLGRDAEVRFTPGGQPVATLNLATTEQWNDKEGQRQGDEHVLRKVERRNGDAQGGDDGYAAGFR